MTNKSQAQKFKELAKEAECDPDASAFDKKLKKIARATATKDDKPKKTKRDRQD